MHCHHVYTPIVVIMPTYIYLGLTFLNVLIFALTFFNVNNMCLSLTGFTVANLTKVGFMVGEGVVLVRVLGEDDRAFRAESSQQAMSPGRKKRDTKQWNSTHDATLAS